MKSESRDLSAEKEKNFHTYETHKIPWYIRVMWIVFWILSFYYLIKYAIPAAESYL